MSSPRTDSCSPRSARSRSKSYTPDRVKAAVEAEEKRKKVVEEDVDTSEKSDAENENADESEDGEEEDGETSGSGKEQDEGEDQEDEEEEGEVAPPLPNEPLPEFSDTNGHADVAAGEAPPPLPEGPPPEDSAEDDGWTPVWDETYQAYYFFNQHTGQTTWTNPRVPTDSLPLDPTAIDPTAAPDSTRIQYNPAIHGDYDPTAPYATQPPEEEYVSRAAFNRFTGKFQGANGKAPENYNDENKSRRQMEFYFDVDAAASSHDGRSLKAERQTRKLTRKEVKAFQEKRRARKEEKRKAWLRD